MTDTSGRSYVLVDRSSVITDEAVDCYALRAVHRRGSRLVYTRRGRNLTVDESDELVERSLLPDAVKEDRRGRLLLPVDVADSTDFPRISWMDITGMAPSAPPLGTVSKTSSYAFHNALSLATKEWHFASYSERKDERPNPRKETLLRQALALATRKQSTDQAVHRAIEKGLDAGLINLATEAFHRFSEETGYWFYAAVELFFAEPGFWPHAAPDFVAFCEKRVLAGKIHRTGVMWGDHESDSRSEALAQLGRFRFFTGDGIRAVELWQAAADRKDVEEVIAKMCDAIAAHEPNGLDVALFLAADIRTRSIRSKLVAELSEYA